MKILSYAAFVLQSMIVIWLAFWAYRRKYELDHKLSRTGHAIRWVVILTGFLAALLQGPEFEYVRVMGGITAITFLAWPNLAYHLSRAGERLFGRERL